MIKNKILKGEITSLTVGGMFSCLVDLVMESWED